MYRNQYDTDVTTFSPAGRLHQVEYAMEAVKQGACVVGARSATHVVLAAYRRSQSELASHQRKVFVVDDHLAIGISGLVADARVLAQYMRTEALNHKFIFSSPLPVGRLVRRVADKSQIYTQSAEKRPYGVGLLVAGCDSSGPHLYETSPSGNYFEYEGHAFGSRSQSAKTYVEKHLDEFTSLTDKDDLIVHMLKALRTSVHDGELTADNAQIAVVGVNDPLEILEGDMLQSYIDRIAAEEPVAMDVDQEPSPSGGAVNV